MMKRGKIFITILSVVLWGLLVSMLTTNCKNKNSGGRAESAVNTGRVINVSSPPFEKFVVVTTPEEGLYKNADTNSPTLVEWVETYCTSDHCYSSYQWSFQPARPGFEQPSMSTITYEGKVFPVLGEEGDFYKVYILNEWCDIESAYILKASVGVIKSAPIKADMLEEEEDKYFMFRVIKDGKYKDIVLIDEYDELGGETFKVGVLNDEIVAIPAVYCIDSYMINEQKEDIIFYNSDGDVSLRYNKSLAMTAREDYESYRLDLKKLTEEQIAKIINTMTRKKPEYVNYMYHFPTLGLQSFYYKEK